MVEVLIVLAEAAQVARIRRAQVPVDQAIVLAQAEALLEAMVPEAG